LARSSSETLDFAALFIAIPMMDALYGIQVT